MRESTGAGLRAGAPGSELQADRQAAVLEERQ